MRWLCNTLLSWEMGFVPVVNHRLLVCKWQSFPCVKCIKCINHFIGRWPRSSEDTESYMSNNGIDPTLLGANFTVRKVRHFVGRWPHSPDESYKSNDGMEPTPLVPLIRQFGCRLPRSRNSCNLGLNALLCQGKQAAENRRQQIM